MKHLIKFNDLNESYSEKCKRCGNPTNYMTAFSDFNEDQICTKCKDDEKNDPDYKDAKKAEEEAIRNGDYNYSYLPNYEPIKRSESTVINEMVDIPKTWTRKEQTDTKFEIEERFYEFMGENSEVKVLIDSYTHLNKEGKLGEHILLKFVPNMQFDFTNLEAIKKGKFFTITQAFADRYNEFLKWADYNGFKVHTKIESIPYNITKKDGKIGRTNPQIKPEINKCQKMVSREVRTIWVIGYREL